jgi:hypothetical protein
MRYVVLKQITWVTCLTRVTLEDTRPHDLSRIAQTSVTDWLPNWWVTEAPTRFDAAREVRTERQRGRWKCDTWC